MPKNPKDNPEEYKKALESANYRCCVCGRSETDEEGETLLEGCIVWPYDRGIKSSNIIVLCPEHAKMFKDKLFKVDGKNKKLWFADPTNPYHCVGVRENTGYLSYWNINEYSERLNFRETSMKFDDDIPEKEKVLKIIYYFTKEEMDNYHSLKKGEFAEFCSFLKRKTTTKFLKRLGEIDHFSSLVIESYYLLCRYSEETDIQLKSRFKRELINSFHRALDYAKYKEVKRGSSFFIMIDEAYSKGFEMSTIKYTEKKRLSDNDVSVKLFLPFRNGDSYRFCCVGSTVINLEKKSRSISFHDLKREIDFYNFVYAYMAKEKSEKSSFNLERGFYPYMKIVDENTILQPIGDDDGILINRDRSLDLFISAVDRDTGEIYDNSY